VLLLGVDHCSMDGSFHPSHIFHSRYMLEDMIRDPWPTSRSAMIKGVYVQVKGIQEADE
jgi:hypothetical protein